MHTPDPSSEEEQNTAQLLPELSNHETPLLQSQSEEVARQREAQKDTPLQAEAQKLLPSDNDAILQGVIYPPPPAFYQQAEIEKKPAIQSATRSGQRTQPDPTVAPVQSGPMPVYGQYPPPIMRTVAPGPGDRQYSQYRPPVKKSYKWVWILVAVLSVVLLVSCGLCSWAGYTIFGDAVRQSTSIIYDGRGMVSHYYDAIENKQYTQAFSYLKPEQVNGGLTLAQFTQQAQDQDTQYGPVYRYTIGQPAITYPADSGTVTSFTLKVNVTRRDKSYSVLLAIHKIDGQWKIVAFDRI